MFYQTMLSIRAGERTRTPKPSLYKSAALPLSYSGKLFLLVVFGFLKSIPITVVIGVVLFKILLA